VTIVLVEGGRAKVMAVAARGTDAVFPAGSARPVRGSVLDGVLEGKLVYRPEMQAGRYPEEQELRARTTVSCAARSGTTGPAFRSTIRS